ncbi:MAG TPA: hypothetical protein VJ180_01390 [Pyrinomonadaceae bacterium]|nr:hypothetical protein [Pyrinomonadaceae bacterium]
MSASEKPLHEERESHRTIIIAVATVAAVAIGLLFYLLMRATGGGVSEPRLQGAIRSGSPEWEQHLQRIVLDEPEADEAKRALGDIVMTLRTTARNFTGRTLNGLEISASVLDHQDKPVKSRTVVVVPGRQPELEPNKTLFVQVMLDGMSESDDRAKIKMEVTGFKFK